MRKGYKTMSNGTGVKRFEHGSAHVWIIIILVVAIIGLLGFIFWQQFTKSDNISDTNTGDETSKVEAPDSNADSQDTSPTSGTYATYTASTGYVKSFQYPTAWRVVTDGDEMCKTYGSCASSPVLMVVDGDAVKFSLSTPQSASDMAIDDQAKSDAELYGGEIASNFTSVDGLDARRINNSDGSISILVLFSRGYGYISFEKSVTASEIDTIIASWKWQ